ncbi:MAG: hypothetical protein H6597_04705 [Flavobacteriales bacterium]|nr:hypothetical protein [Flavobacteriales bacterium]
MAAVPAGHGRHQVDHADESLTAWGSRMHWAETGQDLDGFFDAWVFPGFSDLR